MVLKVAQAREVLEKWFRGRKWSQEQVEKLMTCSARHRLRASCLSHLEQRYPQRLLPQATVRLEHELAVLDRIGRVEDFLIADDIRRITEAEKIPCRLMGAAGNSIIQYLLGVSGIDPLRHNLFFERFRDPKGRWAPPFLFRLAKAEQERVTGLVRSNHDQAMIADAVFWSDISLEEQIPQRVASCLQEQDEVFHLDAIPDDDREAFALLRTGDTEGIIEPGNEWTRDLVSRVQPRSIEDLVAVKALSSIGVDRDSLVNEYVHRGRSQAFPASVKSDMLEILDDSRWVILYQEQAMALLSWFGGVPLADGYDIVKAICKRHRETVDGHRLCFSWNARRNGLGQSTAEAVFDVIEAAAPHTACKSHCIAEALVTYQAAYLKAHYPVEFNRVLQKVLANG